MIAFLKLLCVIIWLTMIIFLVGALFSRPKITSFKSSPTERVKGRVQFNKN